MADLEAQLQQAGDATAPAHRDRRRLLHGRLRRAARRHLRAGGALRRHGDGRRLARGRVRRSSTEAGRRSFTACRPGRHRHRDARQGARRRQRRLRRADAQEIVDAAAPAVAPVPVLELPGAGDRRRLARRARPARGERRPAGTPPGEHLMVPRADDRDWASRSSRATTRSSRSCSATPRGRRRWPIYCSSAASM